MESEDTRGKKELTRAFIAIEFPSEVVKEVARVQELVGKVKFTGKMTELENLHLTLKFLGELDSRDIEWAREKLKEIKFERMKLKPGKLGVFSIHGDPRIVWVKLEGKGIYELQGKIDDALKEKFAVEERFMGHLTIARIKYVKDKKGFLERLNSIKVKPIEFECSEFKLKKSELEKMGPVYRDFEVYSAG